MRRVASLALSLALAAGCSTVVETRSDTSAGTTSGSTTSSIGVTSSSGGAGGDTLIGVGGAGAGGASSTTTGEGGTGGTSSCADSFIDVAGDGPAQHFTALCASTLVLGNPTGPVAYEPSGPGALPFLVLEGCATSAPGSPELSLTAQAPSVPGTDTKATARYLDPASGSWQSTSAGAVAVTIDVYQNVGGVVEGSYTAHVTDAAGEARSLSGDFRVCHVYDIPKP